MQRIDVMTIQEDENNVFIKVIELKRIKPYEEILTEQLPWYIEWICDYLVPNYNSKKTVHLMPAVVAVEQKNIQETSFYIKAVNFKLDLTAENVVVHNVEYIGFRLEKDVLKFKKIF